MNLELLHVFNLHKVHKYLDFSGASSMIFLKCSNLSLSI